MVARSGQIALACRIEYPKAPRGRSPDGKLRNLPKIPRCQPCAVLAARKIWEAWPDALLNSGVKNRKLPRQIAVDCKSLTPTFARGQVDACPATFAVIGPSQLAHTPLNSRWIAEPTPKGSTKPTKPGTMRTTHAGIATWPSPTVTIPAIVPRAVVFVCGANNAVSIAAVVSGSVAVRRGVPAIISRGIPAIVAVPRSAVVTVARAIGGGRYSTNHRTGNGSACETGTPTTPPRLSW
jgi:hypothetical protein